MFQYTANAHTVLSQLILIICTVIPVSAEAIKFVNQHNLKQSFLTVRNHALNRYKAGHRAKRGGGQQAAALEELSELLPSSENVLSELERRELLAAISRFLQSLPAKKRNLFVRRYWGFTSFSDLAAEFGMRENNVQVTLSHIRKKLLAYLRKEGLL